MRITTVRFGTDLWRLLEVEAELAGVSVSQYIREAALARASAAAAVRGQDPLALLGAVSETPPEKSASPESPRARAAAPRRAVLQTQDETRATRAQAEQTVRRAHQASEKARDVGTQHDKAARASPTHESRT